MLTWRAARRAIGSLIFILCPALHSQTFAPSLNYPVGNNPFGVAAADFNRDGKPDLVVVNQASNTISVLLNAGNGTFGTATTYPTGPSPQFAAVGDFNNDGNPDVIVANTNSSTIGTFLGNGDGTLRPMVSIGVGFEPIALAVADFNNDGRLDIAVANFGSNTVSVLLGNGDGAFQVPTDYAVDINPRSIVAGDFNGDGKLDIAVSHGVFTISVLLNAGNGTFAPAVNSQFAFGGGSIAAADLNGDGRLDLVLANQGIGGFSVLLGVGDGTFSLSAQFSTFSGMFPNSIALADMNGDGHIDLIAADPITGVNVFGGDGKGGFSAPARFFADVRSWYAITADFNRDGRPDVAVVNASSNDVSVLVNTTVPAAGSTSGWRMQGINPSRTNAAGVKGPETTPGFKILAPNVNGALTRIAVDGSLILMKPLVANSSPSFGVVSSYSNGGKLQWTTNVPTDLFGLRDIAVSRFGTVYVTPSATLSNLVALDANSGQLLWTQTNNTANRSHPLAVGSDGTIYFTSGAGPLQGKISAVNPDGRLKWQIIGPESNIALSTDESSLYVLTTKGIAVPTGDVRRYSTVDGSFIANTPCDPRGDVYAFAPWNVLYTGNGNNDLLAFLPDVQSCPVISGHGMIAVGIASTTTTGRVITVNNDGTLGGLDQLGNLLWKSAEPLSQAFSSADAVIYAVAPVTNDLVALESEHGAVLWRKHFTDPITGQFLADDSNLYVTAGSNLLMSTAAPPAGTIKVVTNIAQASFSIYGPGVTYAGSGQSFIQIDAPVGSYKIIYDPIPGYVTPQPEVAELNGGETITFNGFYQAITITATLPSISLTYPVNFVGPPSSTQIVLTSTGTSVPFTAAASVVGTRNWLSVSSNANSTPAILSIMISLPPAVGTYQGQITINAPSAINGSLQIPVTLVISPAAPPPVISVTEFRIATDVDEPSIALDPHDPVHAVIGFNEPTGCGWSETHDGGRSWVRGSILFSDSFKGVSDPWVRYSSDGQLFYSCIANHTDRLTGAIRVGIFVATSTTGRASDFQTAVPVITAEQACITCVGSEFTDHPAIGFVENNGKKRLVVCWVDLFSPNENRFLYSAFSPDGKLWSDPQPLGGPNAANCTVGGSSSEIAVTWLESGQSGDALQIRTSTDGLNWNATRTLGLVGSLLFPNDDASTTEKVVSEPFAVAVPTNSGLRAFWNARPQTRSQLFYADEANNWTQVSMLSPTADEFLQSAGTCSNIIGAYEGTDTSPTSFRYKLWSQNSAGSFVEIFRSTAELDAQNALVDKRFHLKRIGDYTGMACNGNKVWAVWTQPVSSGTLEVWGVRLTVSAAR